MARSEARLQFGIWRAGLDGHGPYAKLVYAVLLTEPTINHCGVGAVRTSRWARDASLTIEETQKALAELADSRHVVIDEDTEEIFVRTIIRNDGVAAQPYVLKGALREALLTTSPKIRKVLAGELRKLPAKQPDGVSKAGNKVVYPDPHATAKELDPDPPKPTKKGLETLFDENPSERVSRGSSLKGFESPLGGGVGGGSSSYVATSVEITAGNTAAAPPPENPERTAQKITEAYYELVPLCKFVSIKAMVKRALASGYQPAAIQAALLRLAQAKRVVTVDSLRVELDGPPLRAVSGGYVPFHDHDESAYDEGI